MRNPLDALMLRPQAENNDINQTIEKSRRYVRHIAPARLAMPISQWPQAVGWAYDVTALKNSSFWGSSAFCGSLGSIKNWVGLNAARVTHSFTRAELISV